MAHIEKTSVHSAAEELQRQAITWKSLGTLLLVFDAIPVVFVFVGIRAGSLLWLYWTAIEGLIGLVMIGIGIRRDQQASLAFGQSAQPYLEATKEDDLGRIA
jgi:hypothetical protein